jgi:hypothetical protein
MSPATPENDKKPLIEEQWSRPRRGDWGRGRDLLFGEERSPRINSVCIGPFEDAGAALMRGNYAKASRLLRPLAEPGNTDAQVRLTLIAGAAYKKGDYATAVGLVRPLPSRVMFTLKPVSRFYAPTERVSRRTTRLR